MEPILPKGWKKDSHGNYYYLIGENITTMFSCHLDTADSGQPKKITHEIDGKIVKTDGKTILGGDDKAGAAIIIYMIQKKFPGLYYFFIGEEKGCIGSRALARQLESNKDGIYEKINKVVALDRRGYDNLITFQMGERNCSDAFADALIKEFEAAGVKYVKDPSGAVTDSHHFAEIIPECTNLSVGYDMQHTMRESQDIEFLQKLADAFLKVNWEGLPAERDPKKVERRTYYSTRSSRYNDWGDEWWDTRGYSSNYRATSTGSSQDPSQLPPNTKYVTDYLGNKIEVVNAQWCEYDKQWCLKSDAIWIDYIGFYTCPDFDPSKVKKQEPDGGELKEIEESDVKVGTVLYNQDGEKYGEIYEISDKIYIKTDKNSKFILPMDKLLAYDLNVKVSGGGGGTKKLTENDIKKDLIVYHPIWGEGKIVGIRPDKLIVKVSFKSKGVKDVRIDVADMKF